MKNLREILGEFFVNNANQIKVEQEYFTGRFMLVRATRPSHLSNVSKVFEKSYAPYDIEEACNFLTLKTNRLKISDGYETYYLSLLHKNV